MKKEKDVLDVGCGFNGKKLLSSVVICCGIPLLVGGFLGAVMGGAGSDSKTIENAVQLYGLVFNICIMAWVGNIFKSKKTPKYVKAGLKVPTSAWWRYSLVFLIGWFATIPYTYVALHLKKED